MVTIRWADKGFILIAYLVCKMMLLLLAAVTLEQQPDFKPAKIYQKKNPLGDILVS